MDSVDRRMHLGRARKTCPKCGEVHQIQLTGYINTYPAEWKCRICKHRFSFESEGKDAYKPNEHRWTPGLDA